MQLVLTDFFSIDEYEMCFGDSNYIIYDIVEKDAQNYHLTGKEYTQLIHPFKILVISDNNKVAGYKLNMKVTCQQ